MSRTGRWGCATFCSRCCPSVPALPHTLGRALSLRRVLDHRSCPLHPPVTLECGLLPAGYNIGGSVVRCLVWGGVGVPNFVKLPRSSGTLLSELSSSPPVVSSSPSPTMAAVFGAEESYAGALIALEADSLYFDQWYQHADAQAWVDRARVSPVFCRCSEPLTRTLLPQYLLDVAGFHLIRSLNRDHSRFNGLYVLRSILTLYDYFDTVVYRVRPFAYFGLLFQPADDKYSRKLFPDRIPNRSFLRPGADPRSRGPVPESSSTEFGFGGSFP